MVNLFTSSFRNVLWLLLGCFLSFGLVSLTEHVLRNDTTSYLSILSKDKEFLESNEKLDVIVVGGSNTAFSFSAKDASKNSGSPVLQFG